MAKQNFEPKEGQPYIQLNKLLQVMHIMQKGGHAKILIQNEEVLVNGTIETRIRKIPLFACWWCISSARHFQTVYGIIRL